MKKSNGEIEFVPKKIRDENGKIISITVIKGGVDYSDSNKSAIHQVDGISGATVTADGVTDFLLEDLLRYEKTLDKIRDYGTI
jgi:Na+-transporting NADH:ubiquinone oxidoreductase, subunit NqrC